MAFPRISDQASLIQSIQTLRQFQSLPEPPDFQTRRQAFENLLSILNSPEPGWIEALANESNCSPETVREVEFLGCAEALCSLVIRETSDLPRGLISMLSPRVFPIRLTLERLAPALLAGNVVLLKLSSRTPRAAEVLIEILERAGVAEKSLAVATVDRQQLQPLLTAHPAIRGVSFVGQHSSAVEISKTMDHVRAHFQAWTGGISAVLVMDESALDSACRAVEEELSRWPFASPMAPTKIFVLDSFVGSARTVFLESFQQIHLQHVDDRYRSVLEDMKKESARVLHEKVPGLVENLPNCSELQQTELRVPIVQITSVKYIHEMAKWVNNGFSGFRAVIFGDDMKARRLAGKLEAGAIGINRVFDPGQTLLFGVKESAIGETNLASFFYQRRQISDEKPKQISLLMLS